MNILSSSGVKRGVYSLSALVPRYHKAAARIIGSAEELCNKCFRPTACTSTFGSTLNLAKSRQRGRLCCNDTSVASMAMFEERRATNFHDTRDRDGNSGQTIIYGKLDMHESKSR